MNKILLAGVVSLSSVGMLFASPPAAGRLQKNFGFNQSPVSLPAETQDNMRQVLQPDGAELPVRSRVVTTSTLDQGSLNMKSLSGAHLQGWLTSNDEDIPFGWYNLDTDGSYSMKWSANLNIGIGMSAAWVKNDRLCGLGYLTTGGMVLYYNYIEFDFATGRMVGEVDISGDGYIHLSNYYISAAYVPSEDRIYGYTYCTDEGGGFRFTSSPANSIGDVKEIKALADNGSRAVSLCYNEEEDSFFGITFYGDFIQIDRKGNQTIICKPDFGEVRSDLSALVYSPLDGCFIFNAVDYNYNSRLYFVYPDTGETRLIRELPETAFFTVLMTDDAKYDASAPGRPSLVKYGLENGATSGIISFSIPSATGGGQPLSGQLDYRVYIDNKVVKSGKANVGSTVDVNLDNLSQGEHSFRIVCVANGKEGLSCAFSKYVGNGRPLAPAKVSMTETSVSWNAVNGAELGGYLDLDKLEYEVYLDGELKGTTAATSYVITLDPEKEVSAHYAEVKAVCNGLSSDAVRSNKVIFGKALSLPYTVDPTKEQFEICTVVNADGGPDYGVWDFSQARWHEPVFYSGWSNDPCDDWLILPPVDCSDISHAFRLTLDAICGGRSGDDERFEVWCGDAPTVEAMKTLIIPETQVSNFITAGWDTFSNLFVPKTSGPCYIAIRSVSPPQQYSLLIRKIKIEATDEVADIPMAPQGLTVKSTDDAALSAEITFKAPSQTISGSPFDADARLTAVAEVGDKVTKLEVTPGQDVTMTVNTLQGTNRLTVYCEINGQQGQSVSLNVFTGTIPPNYVENLTAKVTEDNYGIQLKWDAPLGGQENLEGYYSPEGMYYCLYELVPDPVYGEQSWQMTKDLGNVTEYTFVLPEGERLQSKYVAIVAANAAGPSKAISYVVRRIGKPYGADIKESFSSGSGPVLHYGPVTMGNPSTAYSAGGIELCRPEDALPSAWSASIPYAMAIYTDSETGGKARVVLPKVKTKGVKEPVLTLTLWTNEPCGDMSVMITGYGKDTRYTKIKDIPTYNQKWKYVYIEVPEEYCDRDWVELALDCTFPDNKTVCLIGGYSYLPKDLSSVEDVAAMTGVVAGGVGELVVLGHEGDSIEVFATDGRIVAKVDVADDATRIPVAKGIYVVRCGKDVVKVAVR